ncbi:SDR family NAD(P)-dependent oxidoreductase [Photobacterium sp. DA100]|uniref:SDR family NAD(P)-dependent oxidoreductase n=1 Tax=Photobacterium sp. DA100 TaxID=3027472 RepID=UPI00247A580A|nr:SDR family NAD(P)-dependent oxidoreductase [Photobacterium sp. DA100]WEM43641.1 SDR family NAD(P)-dependent oxidoreductase [Photobacterium sp. DA100]
MIKTATVAAPFSEVATKLIEQLISEGTKLVGFARVGDEQRGAELEANYKGAIQIVYGDMADPESSNHMVASAVELLGSIEAHYHCAGVFSWNHWQHVEPTEVARLFNANFQTAWCMSKALVPAMLGESRSSMVFVSARDTSRFVGAGFGPYMASKMALNGLVESLATELISTNITVNAVQPTIINTAVNRKALPDIDPANFVDPAQMASIMIDISKPTRYQLSGALIPINSGLI